MPKKKNSDIKLINKYGAEIARCQKVIEDENSEELEVSRAKNKIELITQAYMNNPQLLFSIVLKAEELL